MGLHNIGPQLQILPDGRLPVGQERVVQEGGVGGRTSFFCGKYAMSQIHRTWQDSTVWPPPPNGFDPMLTIRLLELLWTPPRHEVLVACQWRAHQPFANRTLASLVQGFIRRGLEHILLFSA